MRLPVEARVATRCWRWRVIAQATTATRIATRNHGLMPSEPWIVVSSDLSARAASLTGFRAPYFMTCASRA